MTPSQRAREAAANILDAVSSLLSHEGIGQVADLIRDGEYDEHEVTSIVAQFEAETLERAAKVCEARAAVYKSKQADKADDFENTLNEWEKYQFGAEASEWAAGEIRDLIGERP